MTLQKAIGFIGGIQSCLLGVRLGKDSFEWKALDVIVEQAQLAIDPVHAAGACYCIECKHWAKDPDGCFYRDADGNKRPIGVCDLNRHWHKDNHFCGYGTRIDKNHCDNERRAE